jgi:2-desacetyl-2-hydroxyethyl bacteriochlorophyllide A dehydrogenase
MRNIGIEFAERGRTVIKELGPPPAPGPTQILIETVYSGITNGTERHALMAEHMWGQFPSCHGYQHVGKVVSAGEAVTQFYPGQWVFCGQYVGHRGWNLVEVGGGPLAGECKSHLILPLPDDLDRQECALFGVAGVALRGVRRFRVSPAANVWVCGQGLIGGFAAQAAKAYGAKVTVSDVNPDRLERAKAWQPHRVLDARNEEEMTWAIKEGAPYDCIIDGSGIRELPVTIWENQLLAHHGCIGLLAVRTDTTFHWSMLHGTEGSIEVSCHFTLDDLRVLVHLVRNGLVRIAPMISHRVSIDAGIGIYNALRDRPAELAGVVFNWN